MGSDQSLGGTKQMATNRRRVLQTMSVVAGGTLTGTMASGAAEAGSKDTGSIPRKPYGSALGPRCRVIHVNDLNGDPDGLFALAHAALSPSAQLVGVVGSIGGVGGETNTAPLAKQKADALFKAMGITGVKTFAGSSTPLTAKNVPADSPGARAIIAEANRIDTKLPLYVTTGGGLTDVATALLLDPSIASKFTLVWIGGAEYPKGGSETNFGLDALAAQVVWNDTTVPLWQVDRNAYFSCLMSDHELQLNLLPCGKAGAALWDSLFEDWIPRLGERGRNFGETYIMGDNPLVLLTGLTGGWDASGRTGKGLTQFEEIPIPTLGPDGSYQPNPNGRKIRHYTQLDVPLMTQDFFAKMLLNYGPGHPRR
ncbi:nucleoside hydrolase [Actinoplanes couchii]|uniref:Inosine/uridine-preferring nucleoside hydrolase domain-containing protein n=1 Tax=Actinoplanes couchii TaxID=403638 RepID=A0ABQ3XRU1_9ACTN|nr:nucleoside hydrolase [Actinoplanes couchii]MDR6318462.1 hypothetical protein [Actinoplanes couchii]GID61219.1 hypothetical protein Aco03nite_096230 [Actinoplanes couchii]